MFWAEIIVYSTFAYLAVGILFALWLVVFGVAKLDDSAKETSIAFRLLIFFGAIPFWTWLAWRLFRGEKRPVENNAHRRKTQN